MPERPRPDPDALLALIRAEAPAAARARGRLKIFFGATAGVGKTYAMLEAAHERRRAGADVVIGLVETHGRRETTALLAGLEALPRRRLEHRGVTLEEFDVDAALARRPHILLVDELAHTNAPGSRHAKRWQDVEELLAAGIAVYTTLNVQHIESLNDVVARVTGITVRETVPDSVLESADEVELIDLPPEELLQRLREGKVYMPEQAGRAMERFFQKGNLIALRQMALLRTADRVDRQMELHRRAQAAAETWPVRDRILVGVGPAPSSERLIRATKRMADRLGVEWVAVFVETPAAGQWAQDDRDRLWQSLRLAEQLGGKTVTLSGADPAAEILSYARTHNITKIVVGKPTHATWRDLLGLSFNDRIVRGSGSIDVYVITGDTLEERPPRISSRRRRRPHWAAYGWALAGVVAATLVAYAMFPFFERTNLVMVYLLTVVLIAMRLGRGAAIVAAALSVAAFDFFFVPPYLTFAVSDTQYVVTFAVMLLVGVVIGTLTARLREQSEEARRREWRTAFLYDISRDLVETESVRRMLSTVLPRVAAAFGAAVDVLMPDARGELRPGTEGEALSAADPSELGTAQWVHANRRPAGIGTDTFASKPALFLPLATASRGFGVLRIAPADPERLRPPEQLHLLEAVTNQLAAAIERAQLADEARWARATEEMDRLKSEFVSVASHELKAPLESLGRRVADLHGGEAAMDDIARLRSLVDDLLDLSRSEAGRLELELQPALPSDIVEHALRPVRARAADAGVELESDVTPGLPAVSADARRVEGVLATLLDHALRGLGAGRHVVVSADVVGRYVQFAVADDGPGIPPEEQARVFDRFVRRESQSTEGEPGATGLGLALAREVVRAHRGAIWVDSGPGPGTVFSFTLPLAGSEPRPAPVS
jgi:two-component system sensor histidine kinase KdpD